MKVATVFTACLALAVAHTNHWLLGDTGIPTVSQLQWIPASKNVAWSANSAIPVKVARSLFRTFGLEQPSDTEIMSFADATGYSDVNSVENVRSLYAEPVLIFLEDSDKNVVAYYADSGMNTIKAYPETYANLKSLLGASNAVALAYRPERMLYPVDRYTVSSRFFTPKNFRMEPLMEYARAAENYRVGDAPVVLRKYEIPSVYPSVRSPHAIFSIEKIPYSYKSPVTLKTIDAADYPLWKDAIMPPVYTIETDSPLNTYRSLPSEHYHLDERILKYYCVMKPHFCVKHLNSYADSDVIPTKVLKGYPYISDAGLSKSAALMSAPVVTGDMPYVKSLMHPIADSLAYVPKTPEMITLTNVASLAAPTLTYKSVAPIVGSSVNPISPVVSSWEPPTNSKILNTLLGTY